MTQTGLTLTFSFKALVESTLTIPVAIGTMRKWHKVVAVVVMGLCVMLGLGGVEAVGPSSNGRDLEEPDGHGTQASLQYGEFENDPFFLNKCQLLFGLIDYINPL